MRVEFVVSARGDGWQVARGHTSPMPYPSLERAIAAAENFARRQVERGETAVVRILTAQGVETRRFEPEPRRLADIRPAANPAGARQGAPGRAG